MELTAKQEKELNKHLGLGRHTKQEADIMRNEMEKGKSVSSAHNAVEALRKKKAKKTQAKQTGEVVLDGEKIKFKEGGLRNQLKVPKDYKFKITELRRLNKIPTNEKFSFLGKDFKMTKLMKQRINFGITLMSKKK
jgi:hypothetical protein